MFSLNPDFDLDPNFEIPSVSSVENTRKVSRKGAGIAKMNEKSTGKEMVRSLLRS
ncbi:hypothetical protein L21SP4_00127 [Kiritimatiella glycovorans]|uniref:Uncharacterized protein n=1 Tax=Kiritimatiella glycovorans TaxID=1307763 RepID=A0A0G3EAW7_9BACT|nr:hypothetical protein L21SP4_00127 [Kiritimatiella glycovorans]